MDELSRTWKYDCTAKRMGDMNKTAPLLTTPAFSTPAFSTLAIYSRI